MKKCLFIIWVLSIGFSECVSAQLVVARYIKECTEKKVDNIQYSTKIHHYDTTIISSKVADISYYIDFDNKIKATLFMENGHTFVISVANGLLNDANIIGRTITWPEQTPIYDTVKSYDTVFVSNLVCKKKIIKEGLYIVKVYDYVTQSYYKITTNKETFDALIETQAYIRKTDERGKKKKSANTECCIPWYYARQFDRFKSLIITFSPDVYHLNTLK